MTDPNVRLSFGLQWRWMDTWGLRYTLDYGVIEIYDGALPPTPNHAPLGILLARVTTGGLPFTPGVHGEGALRLIQPQIGRLAPYPGDEWVMTVRRTGQAQTWRWLSNLADPNTDDLVGNFPRIDGVVGSALLLATHQVVAGQKKTIAGFFLQLSGSS